MAPTKCNATPAGLKEAGNSQAVVHQAEGGHVETNGNRVQKTSPTARQRKKRGPKWQACSFREVKEEEAKQKLKNTESVDQQRGGLRQEQAQYVHQHQYLQFVLPVQQPEQGAYPTQEQVTHVPDWSPVELMSPFEFTFTGVSDANQDWLASLDNIFGPSYSSALSPYDVPPVLDTSVADPVNWHMVNASSGASMPSTFTPGSEESWMVAPFDIHNPEYVQADDMMMGDGSMEMLLQSLHPDHDNSPGLEVALAPELFDLSDHQHPHDGGPQALKLDVEAHGAAPEDGPGLRACMYASYRGIFHLQASES